MKKVILFSLVTLVLAPTLSIAGNAASTTYQCYQTGTKNPVAKIELANGTNAAAIHIGDQSFPGTYQAHEGLCPSRLCGSLVLKLQTSSSNAPYGAVYMVNAYFTNSGGISDLTGSFSLWDARGRAPQTIETYCQLKP